MQYPALAEFRRIIAANAAAEPRPQKPRNLPILRDTNSDPGWSHERVELLKKLWADGLSASQIALRIGEVTRNAVIGKVHRLGLAGRATTSRVRTARPRSPATIFVPVSKPSARPYKALPAQILLPLLDETPNTGCSLADLTETMCHFPIGDPKRPGFHYCGRRKSFGSPYCEHHAAIAYNPAASKRRVA